MLGRAETDRNGESAPLDSQGDRSGDLLDSVLAALESGEEVDWDRLRREHADDPRLVGGIARALDRYRGLMHEVRAARGGPHLAPRECLGDFEVVDLLATGGMGEVYRARQLSLGGRLVALKVLGVGLRSLVHEHRFEREALVLSSLHHPNLAEVYGFGRSGDLQFLAMRLVPGISLARFLDERGASVEPRSAVGWTLDVAAALGAVHAAGLVHRDVKPANIVLESGQSGAERPVGDSPAQAENVAGGPRAVLVDFGLARPVNGWTGTRGGLAPMTTAYAAPEQLLGMEVDARADVFSLGVVLHELLTGACPSEGQPAAARGLPAPHGHGIDDDLRAVVAMATAELREERYSDGRALLEDLQAWRERRPVKARRRAARDRLRHFLFRHKEQVARWTGRLLAASVAVGLLAWGRLLLERGAVVRAAAERLDLPALRREYAAIPAPLDELVIRDSALLTLARRVSRASTEEPLARITDRLAAQDVEGALRIAAARIGEVGIAGDPAVLAVLLHPLSAGAETTADPRIRERAFALLAMAAAARPCLITDDDPSVERVRDLVRREWTDPAASAHARLLALSVLGSAGSAEDGAALAARLLEVPAASEELRLGCESLERIVRRSARAGEARAVLDDIPWAPLLARIRSIREAGGAKAGWGTAAAFQRLVVALHLARGRAGRASDPAEVLPRSWLEPDRVDWKGLGHFETVLELAACGDPRAKEFLPVLEPETVHRWQADLAGRVAAFVGDPDWLDVAADRLEELGWVRDEALVELRGYYAAALEELARGESAADAPDDGGALIDAGVPTVVHRIEAKILPLWSESQGALEAVWSFSRDDPPSVMGDARGMSGTDVELRREGSDPPSLLLGIIGRSEVALELEFQPVEGSVWSLRALGQASARRYLPHQGVVRLELLLDGHWVGTQSLSHIGQHFEEFELPSTWLDPGPHTLTLRLGAESTTSYRLLQAVLARREL